MKIKNDRLLKALFCQPVDRRPVWIMRQAGRYLPEYREVRSKVSGFMELCQTPELACKVTMQPLERFALDAAILFSDILTIPDAMGLELYFAEGEGPGFNKPIRNIVDVEKIAIPDPEVELRYVMDAVRLISQTLAGNVPLIGFAGSPWTLATYMIEGGSSKTFSKAKAFMFSQPEAMSQLLDKLAQSITLYLNAQIKAGANAVMIFDSWGGLLGPEQYSRYSLQYMQQIVSGLARVGEGYDVPVIVFSKGVNTCLQDIASCGCDAIGLDWTIDIAKARAEVPSHIALQGNLDPSVLYAEPKIIEQETKRILDGYGDAPGHVFNLGHGIYPDINPEHLRVLIETVKSYT